MWPFPESETTEVITLNRILVGDTAVCLVTHDADDGSWQFLDGEHVFEEDAVMISLRMMTDFDPTLLVLGDLPTGWYAWRASAEAPWQRAEGDGP